MRFSYRTLIITLYLGSLIPLLVLMGLLVYGIQQTFMIENTRNRLSEYVRTTVEATTATGDTMTRLAIELGDALRVLGADVFVKDAAGNPVPPALGTGPWLNAAQHQQALENNAGVFQRLQTPDGDRLVYLAPILDAEGQPLGTVEASLNLQFIETELAGLRRWLVLIVSGATLLAVLLSLIIAEFARRPLGGLIRTASRVAQGDMDSRAPLPNISEAQQLAVTFNTMLDRIQTAMEDQQKTTLEMRRFAADASHELRSPLAVFRNGVEMLQKALDRNDTEQVEHVLLLLRNETNSMTSLVNDLLLLARMESAIEGTGREMTLTEIDPVPLLEEVYERALLLAHGQKLELVWPAVDVPPIFGDRELLRRALNNLVENALRHTPSGKHIYLKVQPGPSSCQIIIQDEGAGIPPDELPRVFERFYRGDTARNRQQSSTGLGLSIVRAIMQAHSGQIQVESSPGNGTTFMLSFPRRASASTPARPQEE
ncbi:MAG: sensor histidine kinase [Anaerolineales bacterium]|jgi:signal transduction histidine kinase